MYLCPDCGLEIDTHDDSSRSLVCVNCERPDWVQDYPELRTRLNAVLAMMRDDAVRKFFCKHAGWLRELATRLRRSPLAQRVIPEQYRQYKRTLELMMRNRDLGRREMAEIQGAFNNVYKNEYARGVGAAPRLGANDVARTQLGGTDE